MLRRGGRLASSRRRALYILPIWTASVIWMWSWWLQPERVNHTALFVPLSLAIFYEFAFLPSVFLYFVLKAKNPRIRIAPKNKKVAVITLCVPTQESMDIIEKQLESMVSIKYPHDSWILDEGGSKKVKQLAQKYGVKYFTRRGVKKYNQLEPPFKAKTKAGNVNAWLEHVKRRKYDFFVQFDIDHCAREDYLNKTLGHFRDEKVAWVQAPSVYKNLDSWVSRGSAEQELVLQGPLQMGFYGFSETPFIIGSHCTYRTSAIREIGGFQPTRAEDHLDTVFLASRGYKGVFIPDIIAQGDGPESLNTYLAQQFAWAYSMFQVLMGHTFSHIKLMDWKRRAQFLFAQTWYPIWSLSYLIMFLSPIIALLINKDIAKVESNDFFSHFMPLYAFSFLVWWSARPIMNPQNVSLSWRGLILHVVRWPIVLIAIINALFRVTKPYMITPKGKFANMVPHVRLYMPFLILGFLSSLSVLLSVLLYGESVLSGQVIFGLANSCFMASICLIDINIRLKGRSNKHITLPDGWLRPVSAVGILLLSITLSTLSSLPQNKQIAQARIAAKRQYSTVVVAKEKTTEQLIAEIKQESKTVADKSPSLGIYDPEAKLELTSPHIQHIFSDWRDEKYLAEELLEAIRVGNTPLITLEPRGEQDGERLLEDIANGAYDNRLEGLFEVLNASSSQVYVRFAHEMELRDLYPWGDQSPEKYIAAYRHFVELGSNNKDSNIQWVWSPAGNDGAEKYYPGHDYVDVVGVTVLHDKYWYGTSQPSFYDISKSRFGLFDLGKPVWIVEFGAGHADEQFQDTLIADSLSNYAKYGFNAIIYLNLIDANIVGPDYRLHSGEALSNALKLINSEQRNQELSEINKKAISTHSSGPLEFIEFQKNTQ